MLIEVSEGDFLDRLTILEIKLEEIKNDPNKTIQINKELDVYQKSDLKTKFELEFRILKFINKKIWDLTNIIKNINVKHEDFSSISKEIFDYNQYRFRIKNRINIKSDSKLKEQKSFGDNVFYLYIDSNEKIYQKIAELNFLFIQYDIVHIITPDIKQMQNIFVDQINIFFNKIEYNPNFKHIDTIEKISDSNFQKVFSFHPIIYVSSGRVGDLIHSLSVVNENYRKFGKKGILYIDTKYESYLYSLERTYEDLKDIMILQDYIADFKIYKDEKYDIHLSSWRNSPLLFRTNWRNIFSNTYNVEWGQTKWLNLPMNEKYKDKILVSHSLHRPNCKINYHQYFSNLNFTFVTVDRKEYDNFCVKTSLTPDVEIFNNLYDLWSAISSCKLFICNLTSALTIAYACNVPNITILTGSSLDDNNFIGINQNKNLEFIKLLQNT